jgi:hypothetical protein
MLPLQATARPSTLINSRPPSTANEARSLGQLGVMDAYADRQLLLEDHPMRLVKQSAGGGLNHL